MSKHVNPGKLVNFETNRILDNQPFVCTNTYSKEDLDGICTKYRDYDILRFDLKEFDSLKMLQEVLIKEIQEEYPYRKMDQYTYLDETLEQLDAYYNMRWLIIIENWDCWNSNEYKRFLYGIFKNGILTRSIKYAIVTGEMSIQEFGFLAFKTI